MTTALLFPGQGSQTSSMRELVAAEAPDLLELCIERIGEDPFPRVDESTAFAQPAIYCASIAGLRRLRPDAPDAYAGHSMGEITALAAAGALTIEDGLRLVVVRGAVMAVAAKKMGGSMLALLKGDLQQAQELVRAHGATIANDNAPGQIVVAGPVSALDGVAADARGQGLRTLRLDVTGAFHSPAMAPAMERFCEVLKTFTFTEPSAPVYSGVTAQPFADVCGELALSLVSFVRWRETMVALARAGADVFVDVGPGEVLARLVARNVPGATARTLEESDALHA
jgi:malonyl CoA-acyl carrier protein transacylase